MADGNCNSATLNLKLLEPLWKCSPKYTKSTSSSPMTDLAMNLEETCMVDTPKRRISWSTTGSTSPCRPQLLSFRDDGFYDSPPFICDDQPVFEERNKRLLQRLHSVPGPSLHRHSEQENVLKSGSSSLYHSPVKCFSKNDRILEDDSNSWDSGFNEKADLSSDQPKLDFKFTEPVGIAPRRLRTLYETGSPNKTEVSQVPLSPISLVTLPCSYATELLEKSKDAFECDDDGFLEEIDQDGTQDDRAMPFGISQLITGKLPSLNTANRHYLGPLHKTVFNADSNTPKLIQGKSCIRGLFSGKKSERNGIELDRKLALKRSDAPRDVLSPIQNKRRKSLSFCYRQLENRIEADESKNPIPKRTILHRCHSETEATIMKAVQRSVQEPNLIGDFSKPYLLPLMQGKHQDLNCISHHTIEQLMSGEFVDEIEKFLIVDCRYPYEYDGGHINGALNIYTKEGIVQEFLTNPMKTRECDKRLVIVFHCEFSSERGPNLSRFLRNKDREVNKECYPQLFYPEIYLLEGGYKSFYENHKHLCEPQEYKPMLHKDHQKDMVHFRTKSKSWNGDKSGRLGSRPGLKL